MRARSICENIRATSTGEFSFLKGETKEDRIRAGKK